MKKALSIGTFAIISLASCSKYKIKGEGSVISETRYLSAISSVNLNGSEDLEIIPSSENKIIVTGYQNLVPEFETNVSGSTLNLEFDDKFFNVRNNNIKLTLYTTNMSRLDINGSGNATIKDSLKSDNLYISVNGSGNVYAYANYMENITVSVNGSGNINARQATGQNVNARISGSGNIEISVLEKLDAKISGSGEINYWGNPSVVNADISGSGKIRKH